MVEAALLNDIIGEHLAGAEGVDEGANLFVGTFLPFMPETLPTFSAGGREDRAAAVLSARAFLAGPAGLVPCTTTLPCRLWGGMVVPWAIAGAT